MPVDVCTTSGSILTVIDTTAPQFIPLTVVRPANPATGSEFSYTATTTTVVQSLQLTLATSSATPTRTMVLVLDDGTNEIARWPMCTVAHGAAQAAGLTYRYSWGPQTGDNRTVTGSAGQPWGSSMPVMLTGYRLRTLTYGLDSGDQYSGVVMQTSSSLLLLGPLGAGLTITPSLERPANPSPGQTWVLQAPLNKLWLVLNVQATLTTSATVVNRVWQVVEKDINAGTIWRYISTELIGSGQAQSLAWVHQHGTDGAGDLSAAANSVFSWWGGMPPVLYNDGTVNLTLQTSPILVRPDDQWSAVTAQVVELPL